MTEDWLDAVQWNSEGLVPAMAQDAVTGRLLMQAYMNRDALAATVREGYATYWSRSRGELWCKGETSGHRQAVEEIRLDCDNDALLLRVRQQGPACHTGRPDCFFQRLTEGQWTAVGPVPADSLQAVAAVVAARQEADPDRSYVASLFAKGRNKVLEKMGEEATEALLAAKDGDREAVVAETADLWFHSLVMLAEQGVAPEDVLEELARRFGTSGHTEKASRSDN